MLFKKFRKFQVLVLISFSLFILGCQQPQEVSLTNNENSIESTRGFGVIDVDFVIEWQHGNVYDLYYNVESTNLINAFRGKVKVKENSYLFPSTYMSESVYDSFSATKGEYGLYIGRLTVPSGTDKVKISISNGWGVYDLNEGSWLSLGSWTGSFSL